MGQAYQASCEIFSTTSLECGLDDSDRIVMRCRQQILEFFRWTKFASQDVLGPRAGLEDRFQSGQGVGDLGCEDIDDRRRRSSDSRKVEDVASRESRRAEADLLDDHFLERLKSDVAVSVPLPGEAGVGLKVRRQKIDFARLALELEIMSWPLESVADRS